MRRYILALITLLALLTLVGCTDYPPQQNDEPMCITSEGRDEFGMYYSTMECGEYYHSYTWE